MKERLLSYIRWAGVGLLALWIAALGLLTLYLLGIAIYQALGGTV